MVSLGLQHRIPLSCDGCHEAKLSGLKHPLRSPGFPDPREDLESRSPNLGLYTTKGTEPPLRDLLFGSSRGSGLGFRGHAAEVSASRSRRWSSTGSARRTNSSGPQIFRSKCQLMCGQENEEKGSSFQKPICQFLRIQNNKEKGCSFEKEVPVSLMSQALLSTEVWGFRVLGF